MKDARNIPAIRFKEFSEAWEQRRFSEITFLSGEKNRDNLPLESYSITNENGFIPQDEKFENGGTMRDADKRMYYIVTPNTFAYNPARINVGSIGYYDKPINVIVSSLYEVFKTTDEVYDRFLWHWFKTAIFQHCIEQLQEGGVRLYFYYDKLCQCSIMLPSYEEQKLVGDELDNIDILITLHQRKIDALKTLKKALLAEMFPDNGSDKPLLRFKGFNDAWEQRKLEDYLTVSKEINSNEEFTKDDVLSVSGEFGVVNQIEFQGRSFAGNSVAPYGVVRTGDVIYTKSPLRTNPFGIIKTNKLTPGIVSTLYAVYHPNENVDSCFIQVYFEQNARVNNYLHPLVNKGAKNDMKVSDENALKGNVIFPSLREQSAICVIFERLDTLITLHQRKLEGLKTMKTFLLQNMFI